MAKMVQPSEAGQRVSLITYIALGQPVICLLIGDESCFKDVIEWEEGNIFRRRRDFDRRLSRVNHQMARKKVVIMRERKLMPRNVPFRSWISGWFKICLKEFTNLLERGFLDVSLDNSDLGFLDYSKFVP